MSIKPDVWMPLYIGDYLRDTTRLTTERHGAYLLLIMDYWVNGAPPDDDDVLASITKMPLAAWKKARAALLPLFQVEDGAWRHKRIDEELLKASENAERYAERAKKAAAKRWEKQSLSNATSNASSIPQAMHGDMHGDATSPSPSSIKPNEQTHRVENSTTVEPSQAASVCLVLKEHGITDINPAHPMLLELLKAGATLDQFKYAAATAKVKKFNYIVGTVKNQREQAAAESASLAKGTLKIVDTAWRSDDNAIVRKAQELKIATGGKTRPQLLTEIDAKQEQIDRQTARGEKAA